MKRGGSTLARRTKNHGCLYTIIIGPFALVIGCFAWFLKLGLYIALYAMIFAFYIAWFLIVEFFKLIRNLIFHRKAVGVHIPCTTGEEYEIMCCQRLRQYGFTHIETTPRSGDHGIDILARRAGKKYAIQCKYYSSPVGNHAVQEAFSGCAYYRYDIPVVLTNNTFTKNAIDEAKNIGVQLWSQNKIPFSNSSMFRGFFKKKAKRNTEQYDQEEYQRLLDNIGNTYIDMLSRKLGASVRLLDAQESHNGYHLVYETEPAVIDDIHTLQAKFNDNLNDHYIFTKLTDNTFSIDQIEALH